MDFVCGVFYTWNTPFYEQHVSNLLTLPRLLLKCAIPRSHLLTLLCFSTPNPSTHSLNIYLFYFFRALCKLWMYVLFNSVVYLCICCFFFPPNWNVTWKNTGTLTYWLNFQQLEKSWNILIIQHIFAERMSISMQRWLPSGLTYINMDSLIFPPYIFFLGIILFNK